MNTISISELDVLLGLGAEYRTLENISSLFIKIYRISSVRLNRYLTLNYSHISVRGCIAETSALVPIKDGFQNEHWVPEMKVCWFLN